MNFPQKTWKLFVNILKLFGNHQYFGYKQQALGTMIG